MPFLLFTDAASRKKGVEIDSATVVGREIGCDIHIPNPLLSRRHCRFMRTRQGWIVEDIQSSRGTFIDGRRIVRHVLAGGEVITAGDIKITFLAEVPAGTKKLAATSVVSMGYSEPRCLEDEVLAVLTSRHDDDEEEIDSSGPDEEELAAIRREVIGESADVLEESTQDISAEASAPPRRNAEAGAALVAAYHRPTPSHIRGGNLWDLASAPVPKLPKSRKKTAPVNNPLAKMDRGNGGKSSARVERSAAENARPWWIPVIRWDKKTIITAIVVGLVVIAVVIEVTLV